MNKNIYEKIATHHDEMATEHADMHKHVKAKHEAMDDEDIHKAFFGKLASHHGKCMKMHKDHADFMRKCAEATPIDAHGDAGEGLKVLTAEDLVKNFFGERGDAPAFTATTFAPARGGPTFAPPLGEAIEMPAGLEGWT